MAETSRHDAWQSGDSYDLYMGRWSRRIAPRFLDWFQAPAGLDWLEIGCGTGALSDAIITLCKPKSLISIDSSDGFVRKARANVPDERATFQVGDAQALTVENASRDAVVSALVLNFIPDRAKALAEMKRVARVGGMIGFYVWDYLGAGVEFIDAFWKAATTLDSAALDFNEDKRFPFCTPDALKSLAVNAGLVSVVHTTIDIQTAFNDFEDFWHPFTLGVGPAPGYCMNLDPAVRQRLKDGLYESLPRNHDGSILLKARALAVKAVVT